jgi:large subunit ribosomal protein L22
MEVQTYIKYNRVSPKKVKQLAHALKGLKIQVAIDRMSFLTDKASRLLLKAIKSVQANAVHNFKLPVESLKIKVIETGKGPFLKRWNPVSRGMAHSIKKRTSHIRVIVESVGGVKPAIETKEKPALPEKIQNQNVKVQSEKEKTKEVQKENEKSDTTKKVEKGKGK